ncbi:MAG TPA: hypothetical protein VK851_09510, partial [Anaerolineales bacterium]|nr:hypothetical protein [Anaerolineales bacterium]
WEDFKIVVAFLDMYLGWAYTHKGEREPAIEKIRSSLESLSEIEDQNNELFTYSLQIFSSILNSLDPTAASRLLGGAYAHHRPLSASPWEQYYRQSVSEKIKSQIGDEKYNRAFAEGEKMSLNEAIEFAKSLVEKL